MKFANERSSYLQLGASSDATSCKSQESKNLHASLDLRAACTHSEKLNCIIQYAAGRQRSPIVPVKNDIFRPHALRHTIHAAARIFPVPCSKSRATVERKLSSVWFFQCTHLFIADAASARRATQQAKPHHVCSWCASGIVHRRRVHLAIDSQSRVGL